MNSTENQSTGVALAELFQRLRIISDELDSLWLDLGSSDDEPDLQRRVLRDIDKHQKTQSDILDQIMSFA